MEGTNDELIVARLEAGEDEDVMQEAYVQAFRKLERFEGVPPAAL